MRAVADGDHVPLERWAAMAEADNAVVWDTMLGGRPVPLLGIESRPLPRFGTVSADGPDQWTSGTLFPLASKKVARAINAASGPAAARGARQPRGLRRLARVHAPAAARVRRGDRPGGGQLRRADRVLRDLALPRRRLRRVLARAQRALETIALEGAHASVIGGAPGGRGRFAREVDVRTREDRRDRGAGRADRAAGGAERRRLRSERDALWAEVRSEYLGILAAEFDAVHSVERAVEVGSVDRIVPAAELRPALLAAVERGHAGHARPGGSGERPRGPAVATAASAPSRGRGGAARRATAAARWTPSSARAGTRPASATATTPGHDHASHASPGR